MCISGLMDQDRIFLYTLEFYLDIKNKMEIIIVSKATQTPKDDLCILSHMQNLDKKGDESKSWTIWNVEGGRVRGQKVQ
jgi:2-C-methyl-D-erythritol 4-phosphate cytidylyltransferase